MDFEPVDPKAVVHYIRDPKRLIRGAPELYRAIHGKRFLLPNYRQNDYYNQEELNGEMEFGLVATALGFLGYNDDVHHASYANYIGALWHDRPILFLEKELGGPLFESALPEGMATEDIQWPWPQFRVYLPYGLLTIERDGAPRSLLYLDVCYIPEEGLMMPPRYARELEAHLHRDFPEAAKNPARVPVTELTVKMGRPYMAISGAIDWSDVGATMGISYALVVPWTNQRIGELIALQGPHLHSALKCDSADEILLDGMLRLALNLLLFLSQKPFFYAPEIVRPFKHEGKHHIKPALARAHFVGAERFKKASDLLAAHVAKTAGDGAHAQLRAHWRKGHWKRQVHGPKNTLRRWQWISIYHTFGPGGGEM